jgi:hypothetical protein
MAKGGYLSTHEDSGEGEDGPVDEGSSGHRHPARRRCDQPRVGEDEWEGEGRDDDDGGEKVTKVKVATACTAEDREGGRVSSCELWTIRERHVR